jgi:hypothetical protein
MARDVSPQHPGRAWAAADDADAIGSLLVSRALGGVALWSRIGDNHSAGRPFFCRIFGTTFGF